MQIFYKTYTLDLEESNKQFDFLLNICKEHNLQVKGLPFVDEETTSSYNTATKTVQSSTTYTDSMLVTVYKTENKQEIPFTDEDITFIDTLFEFFDEDYSVDTYENKEENMMKNIEKLTKGEDIKIFENLGVSLGTSITGTIIFFVTILFATEYNQTMIEYIKEYINEGIFNSMAVTIFLAISIFFFLISIVGLFPTTYTPDSINKFKKELDIIKMKKEFAKLI